MGEFVEKVFATRRHAHHRAAQSHDVGIACDGRDAYGAGCFEMGVVGIVEHFAQLSDWLDVQSLAAAVGGGVEVYVVGIDLGAVVEHGEQLAGVGCGDGFGFGAAGEAAQARSEA